MDLQLFFIEINHGSICIINKSYSQSIQSHEISQMIPTTNRYHFRFNIHLMLIALFYTKKNITLTKKKLS